MRRFPFALVALSAIPLLGCSDPAPSSAAPDAATSDVAPDAPPDVPPAVTPPAWLPAGLAPLALDDGSAPDLACLGAATEPSGGGAPSDMGLVIRDFQFGSPLVDQPLRVWLGDALPTTCDASAGCASLRTDAVGRVAARAPSGRWITVEVAARAVGANEQLNTARTLLLHVVAPTADAEVAAFSEGTRRYLPESAGHTVTSGTAELTGVARDCRGRALANAVAVVARADGAVVAAGEATEPGYAYYSVVNRPERGRRWTNTNGRFLAVNLDPAAGPYRVEVWGATAPGAAPSRVGCESAPALADAVVAMDVGALRGDYPPGHACRRSGEP